MLKLSPRTQSLVKQIFPASEQENAIKWLADECGNNLPFCEDHDEFQVERIRFAVIKISAGKALKMRETIELAKIDWRDVLMWAGSGNSITAHEEWATKEFGEK